MGYHPADCYCGDEDDRIITCIVCGCQYSYSPRGCPHCKQAWGEQKKLASKLSSLYKIIGGLLRAYKEADNACMYNYMKVLEKDYERR